MAHCAGPSPQAVLFLAGSRIFMAYEEHSRRLTLPMLAWPRGSQVVYTAGPALDDDLLFAAEQTVRIPSTLKPEENVHRSSTERAEAHWRTKVMSKRDRGFLGNLVVLMV